MKKNSVLKVVFFTILLTVILTWILPSTYYNGGIVDNGRTQLGLFDLIGYLNAVMSSFGYIPLYILAVGGFYGVLYQTNGYRNLLDKIVNKYLGHEWIFLTLVMIIFAVITSFSGLTLGLLFLFPMIITTILLMGYSKTTAVLTTVGSVCIGLIGTTFSAIETTAINSTLNLVPSSELLAKFVLLGLGLVILIVNTIMYSRKHKIAEARKGFLYPESSNPKAKSWPIVVVFDLVLLIMILSFVSWNDVFSIDIFDQALKSITSFKIGEFAIFAKLLGGVSAFGNWQLSDLIALVVFAALFVAFLGRVKFDDMLKGFGAGARKALTPAFIASILYVLVYIAAYNPFIITIVKPILELTKSFNVVTTSVVAIITHFFNVELYFSASNMLTYITSVFTDSGVYGTIGVIWQATYGLTMLFVPSSVILVTVLSYLNVSYFKWLKAIWKILLQLLVLLLAVFLIIALI